MKKALMALCAGGLLLGGGCFGGGWWYAFNIGNGILEFLANLRIFGVI